MHCPVAPKLVLSVPLDRFLKKWSPGPILAAKIDLRGLILAAKIDPLLPKTVPPLMHAWMHGRTESGKHNLLSGQKRSVM